jgi:UDP-N-acetylmuramoyl-tripeptide--D-alanyl-D-alanine ligase
MNGGFSMRLAGIAAELGAGPPETDVAFTGVSTDTRSLKGGELFVALKGENFDGHDYLARAQGRGAAAALVDHQVSGVSLPQLVVGDTRQAYGRIGRLWRRRFNIPTLALTGSNGKTTVKEMLRSILVAHTGHADAVLATEGNLNNDVGVPQMLLCLRPRHRYAVFELGMNHLGEIDHLARLVEPDVAMVTMAGTAHIGELGSREAIARAKGEIYVALKPDGIAVINMHDRFGDYWRGLVQGQRIIGFGTAPEDDVAGTFGADATDPAVLGIRWRGQHVAVRLQVPGEHNQANALAAAAGACALDIPLEAIRRGLENFSGVEGRLGTFTGHNSATIIDDTYNANPDSVKAAIRVLAARKPPRYLVLGDMGELGRNSAGMHREVGAYARGAGIEKLYALGELSREAVTAFGAGAAHFRSAEDLVSSLQPLLGPQSSVLIKGSRFMKMERVVEKLVPHYGGGHH